MRLRQLSNSGRPFSRTLNKNTCLPPVGHTFSTHPGSLTTTAKSTVAAALAAVSPAAASSSHTLAAEQLAEAAAAASATPSECRRDPASVTSLLSTTTPILRPCPSGEEASSGEDVPKSNVTPAAGSDSSPSPPVSVPKKDLSPVAAEETLLPLPGDKVEATGILETLGEVLKRSPLSARKEMTVGGGFSRPTTSTRFHGLDRRKEFALESLSTGEARTMSGILRQASIEKLGTSHIGSLVSSASKSRMGSYCIQDARIPTPESRLVSLSVW